jgi:hypothetical protein
MNVEIQFYAEEGKGDNIMANVEHTPAFSVLSMRWYS